jgi:hypothetical protein
VAWLLGRGYFRVFFRECIRYRMYILRG